ncbi:MAG: hypothetical protein IJW67_02480 [Blautia sp.]|nr:hypothetical protein [Blautia sp.]
MVILEKKSGKWVRLLRSLSAILLPVILCIFLFREISLFSSHALQNEQATLEQALRSSAVHTYALEGRYPESLDQLLEEYHIQYDEKKFVIEYVPNGTNLFPMISVLPLNHPEGGRP